MHDFFELIMRYLFLCILFIGVMVHGRLPNIIYILADDLGYGDLSCLGQTHFETPHIDRLAREGMLFTQHYAGAPVCAPSRCALMTGKHTGHSVIRGNSEVIPEGQKAMPRIHLRWRRCSKMRAIRRGCLVSGG